MIKIVKSVLLSLLLVISVVLPVGATDYEYDPITTGDTTGRRIEATNKEKFVWRGPYTFLSGNTSEALVYFNGSSYLPITPEDQYNNHDVVMNDDYISYIYCGITGVNCQIYLYDTASNSTIQVTSDDFTSKGSLFINGHKLAWYGARNGGANGNPSQIFIYDIDTGVVSQITTTTSYASGVPANIMPAIINNDIYWVKERTTIRKLNLQTNEIVDIVTNRAIEKLVSDGSHIAWLAYPDQAVSGLTHAYFFDGVNVQTLMEGSYSSSNLTIKGDYVGWDNNSEAYVYKISSSNTTSFTSDSSVVKIEDDRVVYLVKTGIYNNNFVYEIRITNLLTNYTDVINFYPGKYNGLIALGPSTVAWSGSYLAPQNGDVYSTYDQIYKAHPGSRLSAPSGLSATSPTRQKPALSWNVENGATYYRIYRGTTLVDTTTSTSFTDSNLSDNGSFIYSVSAVKSNLEGYKSSIEIFYDNQVPHVLGQLSSPANENSWNNTPITITWTTSDNQPSSGSPTTPGATLADVEGTHFYESGQSCDPAGNCSTGGLWLNIDTILPSGTFTGNAAVIKFLNQRVTGNAADLTSGVSKVEIVSGTAILSSDGGDISLSCDSGNHNCSWTANPGKLSSGVQTLTLKVTDLAGNVYIITKQYIVV